MEHGDEPAKPKATKRKVETEEEKHARLAENCEQKRAKRAQLTDEEIENRRKHAAEYQRERRKRETEEEKKLRNEKAAQRARDNRKRKKELKALQEGAAQRAPVPVRAETEDQRNFRLENGAQRARERIENESEEAKQLRLANAARRTRERIENETEEAKQLRLDKDVRRTRERIENETEEAKQLRLEKDVRRARERIENETEEAKQLRLEKDVRRARERIENETEEAKQLRLEKDARRARERIENETEEAKQLRLEKDARRARERIENETEEAKQLRLEKDARRARERIENETEEAKQLRLEKDARRKRERIENESEDARQLRLEKDARRKRERIENESEDARQLRLEKDARRKRERIENESEDARQLRLEKDARCARERIENESEDARQLRLADAARRMQERIENESEDARQLRLADVARRTREKEDNETVEDGVARKVYFSKKIQQRRSDETVVAKNSRLLKESHRKRTREADEDDATRNTRLNTRNSRRRINVDTKLQQSRVQVFNGPQVELHNLGLLSEQCFHCNALFFKDEVKGKKDAISVCCSSGDVKLANPFDNFPTFLKELFVADSTQSRNFKENIRQFNSALSTASLGAKIDNPPGNGPYCFKVHGQVYHTIGPLHPTPGKQPTYGQIYFLDTVQAAQERLNVPSNSKCDKTIMEELSKIMSEINIFAKSYYMMGEVEAKEEEAAILTGRIPNPIRMVFDVQKRNLDLRRYNLPTSNEVAVVYVHKDGQMPISRSIAAHSKTGGLVRISDNDPCGDPMTYPLFFPHGSLGWHDGLRRERSGRKINHQPYYSHLLQIRKDSFNPIHHGGNLTQQFCVDSWTKTEQYRLTWNRNNQSTIRAEEYKVVRDFVNGQDDGTAVGRRIILPSTFMGSPRKMLQDYQDAMSIVTKFGKPDFFVTFTCNPKWPEIMNNLHPSQNPSDRPDLIARVFKLKTDAFFNCILKQHLLGEVSAYVAVFEWQKRGLPHIHVLLTMKNGHKPTTKEAINRLISAEIPDANLEPLLYDIVTRNMMHRPCGIDNPTSPCMKGNLCSKKFPKNFCDETKCNTNGYPEYMRRDDGRFTWSNKSKLTNQHVVPYNKELLLRFNGHINVEICAQIEAVKYLFKYIYKGSDRAAIKLLQETVDCNGNVIDETIQFLDCRYVCAPEACHHIFGYSCQMRSHGVYRLAIHLPDRQNVIFVPGNEKDALNSSDHRGTTLTAFFKYNEEFDEAEKRGEDISGKKDPRNVPYADFPLHFTFEKKNGRWKQRAKGQTIGRMYAVFPNDPERFALRLLLLSTVGATSFEDLRSVHDDFGNRITHTTFSAAARALGLLKDDLEYKKTLEEAASYQMPAQMRATFTAMLAFNEISDAQELWHEFKDNLSEDFIFLGHGKDESEALAYKDLKERMQRLSKSLETFISPPSYILPSNFGPAVDYATATSQGEALYQTLNKEQKYVCDRVVECVNDASLPRLFYVDGPGGSGKTYMYGALCNILIGKKLKVLCTAWTGIASTLLPEGRTAASLMKLDISNDCRSSLIKMNSLEAKALRDTDVLVWDEASMIPKYALETTNQVLQDIMQTDMPFGGKVIILGGDFRQVLPVVKRGTKSDQIDLCIKSSHLWSLFHVCHLKCNMRVTSGDQEWIEFLMNVGSGDANSNDGTISLDAMCFTFGDLITDVFGTNIDVRSDLSGKAILAPKNVDVDKMNEQVHLNMEGQEKIYCSRDEIADEQPDFVTTEFLNSINTSSLPPHKLKLKKGSVVMLLRNLDVAAGLCNGTRMVVRELGRRLIRCEFAVGSRKGKSVIIPRIDCYDDNNLAFKLRRTQFPIKLAFALSINKAQGQSFTNIGLFLPDDVFTHGQLYVALSRVRSKEGLVVKSNNSKLINIVYKEVL